MRLEDFDKIVSDIKLDLLLNPNRETFGMILSRMNIYLADNDSQDSLAYTDGLDIYFYPNWFLTLSYSNIEFIICHEIMHLILNHLTRREDRNPIVFNFACDYCINTLLINNFSNGKNDSIGEPPTDILYDRKYDNLSAEEIYDLLIDEFKQGTHKKDGLVVGSSISESDMEKLKENGFKVDSSGGVTAVDLREHKTDNHLEEGEVSENNEKSFISDFADTIHKSLSKSTCPSCFQRAVQYIKPTNFNWKQVLKRYIKNFLKQNSTWKRPSKRGLSINVHLPSISKVSKLTVCVAIDVSGSINQEQLNLLLQLVYDSLSQINNYTVYCWLFSGIVHESSMIEVTPKTKNKIKEMPFVSNGSTDISANFKFVQSDRKLKEADLFIVMTDGYDEIVTLSYDKPLLWLIIGNDSFVNPKKCIRGKVIHIENML